MYDTTAILSTPCASTYDTGAVGALTVNHRTWPVGTSWEAIEAGLPAAEATLTGDGRHYDRRGGHEGPVAEWVYVERFSARGREFHGWIDSASRKLLQAG
jgi:hypothetical protein